MGINEIIREIEKRYKISDEKKEEQDVQHVMGSDKAADKSAEKQPKIHFKAAPENAAEIILLGHRKTIHSNHAPQNKDIFYKAQELLGVYLLNDYFCDINTDDEVVKFLKSFGPYFMYLYGQHDSQKGNYAEWRFKYEVYPRDEEIVRKTIQSISGQDTDSGYRYTASDKYTEPIFMRYFPGFKELTKRLFGHDARRSRLHPFIFAMNAEPIYRPFMTVILNEGIANGEVYVPESPHYEELKEMAEMYKYEELKKMIKLYMHAQQTIKEIAEVYNYEGLKKMIKLSMPAQQTIREIAQMYNINYSLQQDAVKALEDSVADYKGRWNVFL